MVICVNCKSNFISINEITLYSCDKDKNYDYGKFKHYSIDINVSNGRALSMANTPYFKVYNNSYSKATECVRIDMNTGCGIYSHEDHFDKMKINSKLIDWLDYALDCKSTNKDYLEYSVYNALWLYVSSIAIKLGIQPNMNHLTKDQFIKALKSNN